MPSDALADHDPATAAASTPNAGEPGPRSAHAAALEEKIAQRTARIGVIGLGYVGLPLMRAFWDAGYPTLGFDVDPKKIEQLHAGENYLRHLGEDLVRDMAATRKDGRFEATSEFDRLGEADVVIICVPTPLGQHLDPDLSYVEKTAEAIGRTLRPGQLVSLESTTYPGTTRDIVLPRLAESGLTPGEEFFVAYSPEREDPGRKDHSTQTIPKLVGGTDAVSGELAVTLYRQAIKSIVPVSSAEVAESAKLLENIYRAVNIAMVNELKRVLTAMGIDVWEVIDAAATKPFGFQPFYPGPGLGGHCIPIDPFYLTWKAHEVGLPTRFIALAGQVNHAMPDYVVQRTLLALNQREKSVKGSRILVLGLAYKPDVDDVRESPSFELIEKFKDLGAWIDYNDPHISRTHPMRNYDFDMASVPLSEESLASYDAVVISTNHSAYDWQFIADNASLVVDTRNAMKNVTGRRDHIVKA